MAIRTVYNRDGSVYGEFDTDLYVFTDDIDASESFTLNTTYDIVKIDGTYYKNDGLPWVSKARSARASGAIKSTELFKDQDNQYMWVYQTEKSKPTSNLTFNSNISWSSNYNIGHISEVQGYYIKDKKIRGSYKSDSAKQKNFIYNKDHQINGTKGDYDRLGLVCKGAPRVVWSNMNDVIDIKNQSGGVSNHNTGGYSEKLYYITRYLDKGYYYYDWHEVSGFESSSRKDGIHDHLYCKAEVNDTKCYSKQQKCIKYTNWSRSYNFKVEYKNKAIYVNDVKQCEIEDTQKILIGIRPSKSIEKEFEDWKYHVMVVDLPWYSPGRPYVTFTSIDPNIYTSYISLSYVSWFPVKYQDDDYDAGYMKRYVNYPVLWNDIDSNKDPQSKNWPKYQAKTLNKTIKANEIEYYDVTDYLKGGNRLNPSSSGWRRTFTEVTPCFKNTLEKQYSNTFSFSLSGSIRTDHNLTCEWKSITVNNTSLVSSPVVTSQTGNLERDGSYNLGYSKPKEPTVSKTMIEQQVANLQLPNSIFNETFINLGRGIYIAEGTHDTNANPRGNYFTLYTDNWWYDYGWSGQKLEDKENAPLVAWGPLGWHNWMPSYREFGPATTSLDAGNSSYTNNPTWFMAQYIYVDMARDDMYLERYYSYNDAHALQIGYTCGFTLNRSDCNIAVKLDSVYDDYTEEEVEYFTGYFDDPTDGLCVIVCDEY